jgi:hypothetical protein
MTKCPECDVDLNALINSERLKAIAQADSDWGFSHEQAEETMMQAQEKIRSLENDVDQLKELINPKPEGK